MSRLRFITIAAALALAGCGGSDEEPDRGAAPNSAAPTETTEPDAGSTSVVDMNDQLAFEPKDIEVKAGQRVTWKNVGGIGHTVTADKSKAADPSLVSIPAGTKEWDSGFVNEGEKFSRKFDEPGTYRYICIPHEGAGMTGTVVVK